MFLQILAGIALLLVLFALFRFAMGLRYSKMAREGSRAAEEARGRRVLAEIPLATGELALFVEDDEGFYWGEERARKRDIVGGRLLLNGGIMGAFSRDGATLPEPPAPEEHEGRERWDVLLYLRDGRVEQVPCGALREGVSREIAGTVFGAAKRAAGV